MLCCAQRSRASRVVTNGFLLISNPPPNPYATLATGTTVLPKVGSGSISPLGRLDGEPEVCQSVLAGRGIIAGCDPASNGFSPGYGIPWPKSSESKLSPTSAGCL